MFELAEDFVGVTIRMPCPSWTIGLCNSGALIVSEGLNLAIPAEAVLAPMSGPLDRGS
jgi:hypothetical protein